MLGLCWPITSPWQLESAPSALLGSPRFHHSTMIFLHKALPRVYLFTCLHTMAWRSVSQYFKVVLHHYSQICCQYIADVPEQSHTSVHIDRVEVYPRTSGGNMPEIKSNRMHTAALEHQSNRDRVDVAAVDGKIVRVPSIQCFPSKVPPPVHCITPLKNCRTGLAVGICSLQ